MPLFLIEIQTGLDSRDAVNGLLASVDAAAQKHNAELLESKVTDNFGHLFVVLVADNSIVASSVANELPGEHKGPDEVRLVGQTIDEVRAAAATTGEYLVEWDFPSHITMDAYLTRKAEKTPLYDDLDDVTFLRTYVREDLEKCLCVYDADEECAVVNAREVVEAPISRMHHTTTQQ